MTSVAIVSVSGLGSLQDARDAEQLENAERAFDVFADNLADLHRQGAPSRATEISLAQAQLATEDNVTMSVEIEDGSASTFTQSWEVRPLVYSGNQDRELVYEAGAVFRTNRDSGIVVREPPLAVNDDRVLFSIIGLNSPQVQSLGGSTVLVRTDHRAADVVYTNTTGGITRFEVTVRSPGRRSGPTTSSRTASPVRTSGHRRSSAITTVRGRSTGPTSSITTSASPSTSKTWQNPPSDSAHPFVTLARSRRCGGTSA
ncbi:hypothetical protein ACFQH8_15755 [Halomicroarcula sp. GCM10025710]